MEEIKKIDENTVEVSVKVTHTREKIENALTLVRGEKAKAIAEIEQKFDPSIERLQTIKAKLDESTPKA